jgi:hypothetical protein
MPSHRRPPHKGVRSERKTAEDTRGAVTAVKGRSPATLWAYTYQIVPRQTRRQLRAVSAVLDHEHSAATDDSGRFAGRLIVGARVTRILIVSDCPERNCEVNQRLEAELANLQAEFSVSEPVALSGGAATPT